MTEPTRRKLLPAPGGAAGLAVPRTAGSRPPLHRAATFFSASTTNAISATAVMLPVAEGEIARDDEVERCLLELADRRALRHVDLPMFPSRAVGFVSLARRRGSHGGDQ